MRLKMKLNRFLIRSKKNAPVISVSVQALALPNVFGKDMTMNRKRKLPTGVMKLKIGQLAKISSLNN
jgi:hypothetical protein